jgi:hypothetical protein
MVNLYWTIGAYDLVAVFDMPDHASFTAMALEIGALRGGPCRHPASVQRGRVQADRGQDGLTVSGRRRPTSAIDGMQPFKPRNRGLSGGSYCQ